MTAVSDWTAVESAMDRAVGEGVFPGAALLVARVDEVLFHRGFGRLDEAGPEVTASTVYDVSSLTKPLVTAACVLKLVAEGKLSLDRLDSRHAARPASVDSQVEATRATAPRRSVPSRLPAPSPSCGTSRTRTELCRSSVVPAMFDRQ